MRLRLAALRQQHMIPLSAINRIGRDDGQAKEQQKGWR